MCQWLKRASVVRCLKNKSVDEANSITSVVLRIPERIKHVPVIIQNQKWSFPVGWSSRLIYCFISLLGLHGACWSRFTIELEVDEWGPRNISPCLISHSVCGKTSHGKLYIHGISISKQYDTTSIMNCLRATELLARNTRLYVQREIFYCCYFQ